LDKPFTYYSQVASEGKTDIAYGEEIFQPLKSGYKGKLYFLIDGNGNSTTGHFMSLVKVHNLGTIIGEELGSNQFCKAGQTLFRLCNRKFVFHLNIDKIDQASSNIIVLTSFCFCISFCFLFQPVFVSYPSQFENNFWKNKYNWIQEKNPHNN